MKNPKIILDDNFVGCVLGIKTYPFQRKFLKYLAGKKHIKFNVSTPTENELKDIRKKIGKIEFAREYAMRMANIIEQKKWVKWRVIKTYEVYADSAINASKKVDPVNCIKCKVTQVKE